MELETWNDIAPLDDEIDEAEIDEDPAMRLQNLTMGGPVEDEETKAVFAQDLPTARRCPPDPSADQTRTNPHAGKEITNAGEENRGDAQARE